LTSLRIVLSVLVVQAALILAAGYLGPFTAIGDSFAIFRPQIAVIIFAASLVLFGLRSRLLATTMAAFALFAFVPIAMAFSGWPASAPGEVTLYQKNIMRKALSRTQLTHEIMSLKPDMITLQEITEHDHFYLAKMFDAYEYKAICDNAQHSQIGILSRFPIIEGSQTCLDEDGLVAAQIRMPGGAVIWLASVHLGWPFPAGQYEQATNVAAWLSKLDKPVIIGGDFNMVPWGYSVQTIARAAGVFRVLPYFGSFPESPNWLPLPIDQVMLPMGSHGVAEQRPQLGSDHLGMLVRFGL